MCGINGILRLSPGAPSIDREELLATREALSSRGPDGEGAWWSADGRIALGHRRLAILDLSPAGAQPMASPDGRLHIVYNGEIYNFRQLRRELEAEGRRFATQSDTEVILALYERDGFAMLGRLRGMYAFALWDEERRRLLLARDPLGIKPLYYSTEGAMLRFASQVKALVAGGRVSPALDPVGLAGFLLWGSVPEPWTIRRAIRALPAGHFLLVEDGRLGEPRRHDLPEEQGPAPDLPAAVADSVRSHLVSDVPVAVFLSAGIDSSLVAALAVRQLPEPPLTFTLSFDLLAGSTLDEAPLAAETARRLGTRHLARSIGRYDFEGLWAAALAAMDQPSIDGFNTFLVARAAHEAGVKVALSGLGGDELFGSYPSFADVPRLARLAAGGRRVPGLAAAWPALARLAAGRPKLAGLLRYGATLPGAYFLRRGLYLPEELPALLGRDEAEAALAAYDPLADAAAHLGSVAPEGAPDAATPDPWLAVHRMETGQYLKNQLLRDADWAGMASSVEIRVPFVDAHLRQACLARGFESVRREGKAALARRLAPELPEAVLERPKTGFFVPVAQWLAGDGAERTAGRADGSRRRPALAAGLGSRRLARRMLADLGVSP
jgi:asparagine synthase (glutamine-hydrolysing)